jgi:hypothetical protein
MGSAKRLQGTPRLAAAVATVVLLLAACTSGGDDAASPSAAAQASASPAEPMNLDVFVYNVEYGGDPSTDAVIRDIDADVVGVLESYDRLPEIAENTGYPFYNTSLQILSKFPIHEPSGADGRYAFIEVRPGEVVAFFNIHLDYVKYGPTMLRNGRSLEDVLASEDEVRTSSLDVPLGQMRSLIDQGYPVFFTGDHNEPSSLDYGEETIGTRKGIDQVVQWPVSEEVLGAGFRDTYREIHPDPVAEPGITHQGAGDRIDYVYAAGPSETLDSRLVGEEAGQDVEVGFKKWTSDHRAVVSTFEVTPVPMPTMVSVEPALLTLGDPLTVAYQAPEPGGEVQIAPADVSEPVLREEIKGASGSFDVDPSSLTPGAFDALLVDEGGSELARVSFFVRDPDAMIRVSTDRSSYGVGEPIEVSWDDGPANRWDWIGVYKAKAADPKVDYYLDWNYTGLHDSGTVPPSTDGSLTIDGTAQGAPWPLPPGKYVVHYLVMDQYRSIGSAEFQIIG